MNIHKNARLTQLRRVEMARDVAIRRCQERGGDTLTGPDPIAALHQQLSSLGALERHVLSTDGHTREDTLSAVINAVNSGCFRLLA